MATTWTHVGCFCWRSPMAHRGAFTSPLTELFRQASSTDELLGLHRVHSAEAIGPASAGIRHASLFPTLIRSWQEVSLGKKVINKKSPLLGARRSREGGVVSEHGKRRCDGAKWAETWGKESESSTSQLGIYYPKGIGFLLYIFLFLEGRSRWTTWSFIDCFYNPFFVFNESTPLTTSFSIDFPPHW